MTSLRALSAAGVVCLGLGIGCAPAADEQVLTRFFEASRTFDSTQLDRFATVVFNPRTDGSIQRFSVINRGSEQRVPVGDSNREAAVRSLASLNKEGDVSNASLQLIERQITLEADVRAPGGTVRPGVVIATLQRVVGTSAGVTLDGQWIVTRLRRAPGGQTSRAVSSGPLN